MKHGMYHKPVHHKLHRMGGSLKKTFNNGLEVNHKVRHKVGEVAKKAEHVAGQTDSVIRGAYSAYRVLEPVLPLDREIKMGIRTFMGQYDQTADRISETYNKPVRELVMPRVRHMFRQAINQT